MQKSFIGTRILIGGLMSLALVLTAQADHHKQDEAKKEKQLPFIAGVGMCASCELGVADSCQNAIQVKQGKKTITYLLTHNAVSKDFHGTVCKSKELTAAVGKLKKKDATTFELTPKKVAKAQKLEGKAMCARCELGEADDCQSVIQAKKEGKLITYALADNKQSKKFHKQICQSVKPVTAIGLVKKHDKKTDAGSKPQFIVGQIEVAEKDKE